VDDDMQEFVEQASIRAARRRLNRMSLEERLELREEEGVPLDDPKPADNVADLVRQIRGGVESA
jgi:hypothetical protein